MVRKLFIAFCMMVLCASTLLAQGTRTSNSYGASIMPDSLNQDDHSGTALAGGLKSTSSGTAENTGTKTHIYPNPSKGMVYIVTNTEFSASELFIEVSDLSGKIIRYSKLKAQEPRQVDLSELNDGLYFLKFIVGNKTTVRKVVVDRN